MFDDDHWIFAVSPATKVTAVFGDVTVIDRDPIVKFVFDVSRTDVCVVPLTRMRAAPHVGLDTSQRYAPVFAMLEASIVHVADGYVRLISIETFSDMF